MLELLNYISANENVDREFIVWNPCAVLGIEMNGVISATPGSVLLLHMCGFGIIWLFQMMFKPGHYTKYLTLRPALNWTFYRF
jgi:hypothetical protein